MTRTYRVKGWVPMGIFNMVILPLIVAYNWNTQIVPTFGLPAIDYFSATAMCGLAQALGICIAFPFSLLRLQSAPDEDK